MLRRIPTRPPSLLSCLVLLVLAGCEESPGDTPRAGPAGRSTDDLAHVATSGPDAEFTHVRSIDVDSRGEVYVSDFPDARITVLSGDGSVVRTIGRKGQGPGEYQFISNVQLLGGDSLLVYDQGLNRVTVYSPGADRVAYTVNFSQASRKPPPYWVRKLPDERAFLAAYRTPFAASGDPALDANRREVLALLNEDGSIRRDSLVVFPGEEFLVVRRPGAVSVGPNPFGRRGVFGVGAGSRIYVGWTDGVDIDVYSPEGSRLADLRAPSEPPRVTGDDVRAAEADLRPEFKRVLSAAVPETWPAMRGIVVDDRDRLWVMLTGPRKRGEEGLVLNSAGERVASLRLPDGLDIRVIRGGLAYSVESDTDGVPHVAIHRLTHPSIR
jgi:hypothetical protein